MRARSRRISAPTQRAIAAFAIVLGFATVAHAEPPLSADLSAHHVTTASGPGGAVVTLFGTIDAPGDIVVVVRGPEADAVVRRGPFGNFWLTAHRITFAGVPGYYAVYASAPLDAIVPPEVQALHQIGLANLLFQSQSPQQDPALVRESRAALIAERQSTGVYVDTVGKVGFVGGHLFRATLAFPADAPAGSYFIEVLLLHDKALVGGQTMSLVVARPGTGGFAGWSLSLYAALTALAVVVAAGVTLRMRRRSPPPAIAPRERPARPARRAGRR